MVTSVPKLRKIEAELHAHRARADDDQRLGHAVDGENLNVGEDASSRAGGREASWPTSRRQNHVLRLHLARSRRPAQSLNRMHAVLRGRR